MRILCQIGTNAWCVNTCKNMEELYVVLNGITHYLMITVYKLKLQDV